jgi:PAS domain S-box-containing protein
LSGVRRSAWSRIVHAESFVRWRPVAEAIAAGLVVFALAGASIATTHPAGQVALLWPANAVIVACVVNRRLSEWPAFMAAGLLANFAADVAWGDALFTAGGLSIANLIEMLVCAGGIRVLAGPRLDLSRLRHLVVFGAMALAGALASAGWAGVMMQALNRHGFMPKMAVWTLADVLGLTIVTPALLALDRTALRRFTARDRLAGNLGVLALLTVATTAGFLRPMANLPAGILPLLVLVAFRAETAGAAIGILILGGVTATLSKLGLGPVPIRPGSEHNAILLQLFLLMAAVTAFPVAAEVRRRRELEEAEAHRADEYQLLADHSTDLIIRFDRDDTILYISPSCRRYGYEPHEVIGRCGYEFVHPDDLERVRGLVGDLFSGAEPDPNANREQRVRSIDGRWVWFEGNPQVIRSADGQPIEFVTQLRDIDARKALEAELERKRVEAEAAAVAKSEFLANMSHEIRTPLTGVLGFSGMLQRLEGLPDQGQVYIDRIVASGQTLLSVVNDILDFSKIEAGQLELDPQPFAPAAFVAEAVGLVQAQADAKSLALSTRLDPTLPAAVTADSARLRQVLLNLLSNAIKFTDRGEVRVEVGYQAGLLRVAVVDTGVGIPPDRLDRLFQRFSQADGSINRQFGGTGLGLAICKSLSELMGGAVGVASTPGEGSTFWFTAAAPQVEAAAPASQPVEAPAYAGSAANVLVVDDNPVNREVVKALLEGLGLTLVEAGGGAEAVERAMGSPFDLILMDLQMPGMDGLAATRAIRQGAGPNCGTPIVALSANVLSHHLEACREAGMNDHIGKPIVAADLLTKVALWTAPPEAEDAEAQA